VLQIVTVQIVTFGADVEPLAATVGVGRPTVPGGCG